MRADRSGEEPASRQDVVLGRDIHVDDLAVLIDGPIHVPPLPGDLHVGLVDEPTITDRVAAWPRRVGEERREPLHPAVDGGVIDLDPTLTEELLDVANDSPYRRYHRTARTMTSGGNRNPRNAERSIAGIGTERRGLIPTPSPAGATVRQCNSPVECINRDLDDTHRLRPPTASATDASS